MYYGDKRDIKSMPNQVDMNIHDDVNLPPQPTGGENERLAKWGDQILDNFNDAVVRLSLTVADEKEWAKRYEKLKAETLSAFDDSIVRPTLAAERTLSYNKGYEDAKKECANDRKVS